MWSNYIILIVRKFKSWSGLSLINMIGLIAIYGLEVVLIRGFVQYPTVISLLIILLILFVAIIAYANYISLQLRTRTKEFYIRKLLGAKNIQVHYQLLLESMVFTSFLVVSGMVVAELALPWCDKIIGTAVIDHPISLFHQILMVISLVVPVAILGVTFPVQAFISYINKNFAQLSRRKL
jgi:cell division protein FtsX